MVRVTPKVLALLLVVTLAQPVWALCAAANAPQGNQMCHMPAAEDCGEGGSMNAECCRIDGVLPGTTSQVLFAPATQPLTSFAWSTGEAPADGAASGELALLTANDRLLHIPSDPAYLRHSVFRL